MGASASLALADVFGCVISTDKMANYAFAFDIGTAAAIVVGVETGLVGVDDDYYDDEIEL